MSLLQVGELETGYGRIPVLHGVSLEVAANEVVAVVGPNGAGKTSLLKAVFGLLPALGGSIRFDGEEITGLRPDERQALGMSLVPQTGNTFPDLSVEDNLLVSFSRATDSQAAVAASFEMFPVLSERRRQPAKTLSGGERQMLAFASGIGTGPRFMALDEPTTGLAPTIVQGLIEKILESRRQGNSILWIVEEDPLQILPNVDRVYVLNAGTIQAEMPAEQLLADEALLDLFFGTNA